MLRFFIGMAACLLCMSCGPVLGLFEDDSLEAGDLNFSTDRPFYIAGDSVVLRLENPTTTVFSYSFCGTHIEPKITDVSSAEDTIPELCLAQWDLLSPGGTANYTRMLPGDIPAGRYRFWTRVEFGSGRQGKVYTDRFEVSP